MAAPEPSSRPVPMEPPTPTMAICPAVSCRCRPASRVSAEAWVGPAELAGMGATLPEAGGGPKFPCERAKFQNAAHARPSHHTLVTSVVPPLHCWLRLFCLQFRRPPRRTSMLDLSRRSDKSDIGKRREKAEKYLQKGKIAAALEEYVAILQDDPENDTIRQAAADLYIQ